MDYRFTLILIAVIGIIAFIIYRRWILPVKRLNEAVKHMAEGDFDHVVPASGRGRFKKTINRLESVCGGRSSARCRQRNGHRPQEFRQIPFPNEVIIHLLKAGFDAGFFFLNFFLSVGKFVFLSILFSIVKKCSFSRKY